MDHIAIDIGASNGRILAGTLLPGKKDFSLQRIRLKEIYRFENKMIHKNGHWFWDIDALFNHLIKGLQTAHDMGIPACTAGIDTWGVDYVLIDRDGNRIRDVYCYRDPRTSKAMEAFYKLIPREVIYEKTGIQFLQFNTIYQLFVHDPGELKKAYKILLIPDYLYFLFTGKLMNEKTNASTTQLLNLASREFDPDLLSAAGVKRDQFAGLTAPGISLGKIKETLKKKYNLPDCEFISAATHDTASAVLGTPCLDDHIAFLSSGTWSLIGIEKRDPVNNKNALYKNITNEWGAGDTYRILKNVTGLWLIQEVKRNYRDIYDFEELLKQAQQSTAFQFLINCNDKRFLNPGNMVNEIRNFCLESHQGAPDSAGGIVRCIIDSLALMYRYTLKEIEEAAGCGIDMVTIIGGGARNKFLCQATADVTGRKIMCGPVEATAIGNIIMQMIGAGEVDSIASARSLVKQSFAVDEIIPDQLKTREDIYGRFCGMMG
ncbi:MAG: rhamnulokinase [Spirochaetales bacterium]|nr:rhamnulokinase [Spirochaetales bacterium]